MTIYDEYYRESPMQEILPTPGSTVLVTTVYQPPVSHAPTEAEIMATHEALLESLTLSSSSSDRSLTHQKEKIPTSQLSKIIPSTQKEAGKTYPISTQTIQEPERRSTTTPARTSQPRGFEPMNVTTVVSTIIPATHPTQTSEMSTISGMTTTVPTTATRIIPITQEESRSRALEAVRRLVGPNSETASQLVTESMRDEVRVMSPPPVPRTTGAIALQVGTAVPMSQDLIWPGHPEIRGTTLFPQEDDPMTQVAGGLNPDERWKVFHPYDIPGVRRPTMATPENIRRMAESEVLVEPVQTMEYLNEFHPMGERRDFRRFPPRYGDPHYHPNRLGRRSIESNQERQDNQTDNTRSSNRRDQQGSERRPAYGRGGFMSPKRRVAEAAQHVPEAVYSDAETQNRSPPMVTTIPEERQRNQSSISPQGEPQNMERGDSLQQQFNTVSPTNFRDDWEIEEPVIIPVSEPVLNGGPPVCNRTPTPIPTEPPGGERERILISPRREEPLFTEKQRMETAQDSHEVTSVLPSKDLHIPCSICEVIDCMIHNPHHRYCMDCGRRLLGPHICPNVDQDLRRPHTPPQIPREPLGITMFPEQLRRNVPCSMEGDNIVSMEDSEVESFRDTVRSARMLNMDLIPRSTDVPPLIPSRRERSTSSAGPPPYKTILILE